MTVDSSTALAETIARIRAVSEYCAVQTEPPQGEGWMYAADLVAPNSPQLATVLAQQFAAHPTVHANIVAINFADKYCWYLTMVALGCFLLDRRGPDVSAHNVAIRFNNEGAIVAVALLADQFVALATDPAADSAQVMKDETVLRQWLLTKLKEHLSAFYAGLRQHTAVPERRLWLACADYLASFTIYAYGLVGQADRAEVEAQLWLDLLWFRHRTELCSVACGECSQLFAFGATCCYAYKYPQGQRCGLCPELPRAELLARAEAFLHKNREKESI